MAKTRRKLAATLRTLPDAESWPEIGLGMDLFSTDHFLERVALMLRQGMTREDIADALRNPIEVKSNPDRERLYYCGRRVAVVVGVHGPDVFDFVTVLWASERLWEQNPRPEKEAA